MTGAGEPSETPTMGSGGAVKKAGFVEGLQRVGVTFDGADVDRVRCVKDRIPVGLFLFFLLCTGTHRHGENDTVRPLAVFV